MIKVVFVGDEPSELNVNPFIPFVGARCFSTLVSWIKFLEPDYYIVSNSDQGSLDYEIKDLYDAGFQLIALGSKAAKRLDRAGMTYYRLPHPSPKNLQMNDKKSVNNHLMKCRNWLWIGV